MAEEDAWHVVEQVGAIDEVARFLSMPSSQVNYRSAMVLGVATVAVAAALGGIVYYSDRRQLWGRKKRYHPLSQQQWLESFESKEGRLMDPERVITRARRGGIDRSIRSEVWPFLLGLYELNSTESERKAVDFIHSGEFEELRRQCGVLRRYVSEELTRMSLEKDDPGSFEKVNEADIWESMLEEKDVPDGTDSSARTHNKEVNILTRADSKKTPKHEPSENPKVDSFLERGLKAMEDFRDWQRIIRLDAVRMNAEWVPYSAVQANVTEEEANRCAEEVGIQDHSHLEASRTHHAARLVAILEAYALFDPETGYCQGMSDLLSPFVALMDSDSQALWCFVQFMKRAKDNFRIDETGIRRQLQLVTEIFRVTDPHFYHHLVKIQGENCFFVYRMVVVLFRRELTFEQTVCLWEVIWADWAALRMAGAKGFQGSRKFDQNFPASEDFLLFTIVAAVLQKRKDIIERCEGVDEVLRECNAMARKLDVWRLIDHARELVRDFQQKVKHQKIE